MCTSNPDRVASMWKLDSGYGRQRRSFDCSVTSDETPAGSYNAPMVDQIAGTTYRQLDYWPPAVLVTASINPAGWPGTRRLYSVRDILIIKIIASLLDTSLPLKLVGIARATLAELAVDDLAATTLFSDTPSITAGQATRSSTCSPEGRDSSALLSPACLKISSPPSPHCPHTTPPPTPLRTHPAGEGARSRSFTRVA